MHGPEGFANNMALLTQFDAPAFLPDFNSILGQVEAWSEAVSGWFDSSIKETSKKVDGFPIQFFNPLTFDPSGILVEQAIVWNAFPKQLFREFGRDVAFQQADLLRNQGKLGNVYFDRPQEEYCEWHVRRDANTNKILSVTFTSEPPEYWQALAGLVPGSGDSKGLNFPSDLNHVLRLYRELVSSAVELDDLIVKKDFRDANDVLFKKGDYNIYNKWNTSHGIAHLNSQPNSLQAEIQLGADASLLYLNPAGQLLVEPEALIAYGGYGGANRNSDPTIGSSVNALARLGAYITLLNPVGLYMDNIDLSGWAAPDGGGVEDCVRVVRGKPGMIERMVAEVPAARGFTIGDIMINGNPIRYGGEIAECITVKLTGIASILPHPVKSRPASPQTCGFIDPAYPTIVGLKKFSSAALPNGTVEAFLGQGIIEKAAAVAGIKSDANMQPRKWRGRATYSMHD